MSFKCLTGGFRGCCRCSAVMPATRGFQIIAPAFVLAVLLAAAGVFPAAANRGIAVTAKTADGQTLDLYEHSYALLIGVSRYQHWPILEQIPREVTAVRRALEKQGFAVTARMDPDGKALEAAFEDFIDQYGYNPQNRLLFFYAGHGYTLRGGDNGYLVPVNAPDPRKDKIGFKRTALDMNDILAGCRKMDARHALFLFDSCFSGTIFKQRDLPAAPPAVSQMTARPVRQFITAGTAGEAVPAKSTFTPAFVDALEHGLGDLNRDGYVSGTELGLYLQDEVPRHVPQTPQYGKINDYDLSRGDFIFLAGGSTLVTTPAPAAPGGGTLKINVAPAGAEVFVNNTNRGTAPLQLPGLLPGDYQVRAQKSGYESQSRKVTVRSGRIASVRFYLDAVRRAGRLYVHPEPTDARVRIMNINPAYHDGMALEPGRYQVQVEKPGYETVTRWETLKANEDMDVYISLKKNVAAPSAGGQSFTNDLGMKFVWISPGTFTMGSPSSESGRDGDEKQHKVTLTKGFYMQTTEVTIGQWRAFIRETGYRTEAETGGGAYIYTGKQWENKAGTFWDNPGFSQTESHPVTCVSWNDVQKYIDWLNRKDNKTYRLPTEAEWEYACRAGSTTAFANGGIQKTDCKYDPNLDKMGWYCGNAGGKTHAVAQKQPNAWELYDMHGNVCEWCSDWYGDFPSGLVTDPDGSSSGSLRVIRGGSWDNIAQYCRSAIRSWDFPGYRDNYLGFRLVCLTGR
ncbi:MAG: SUMF1/EgtB/PvdO family nonheme iron enzyme [Thermodesulfobacteriota bacterium]|nr:SUMF1/EgtB/PvdO family nonheme iron enzyme [Thermodesulfobacteriota bacterium]